MLSLIFYCTFAGAFMRLFYSVFQGLVGPRGDKGDYGERGHDGPQVSWFLVGLLELSFGVLSLQ